MKLSSTDCCPVSTPVPWLPLELFCEFWLWSKQLDSPIDDCENCWLRSDSSSSSSSTFGAVKCCHFLLVLASLSYLIVLASDDIYHVQVDSFAFPIYYVLVESFNLKLYRPSFRVQVLWRIHSIILTLNKACEDWVTLYLDVFATQPFALGTVWSVWSGQTRRCLFLGRLWVYERSDCCSRTVWEPRMLEISDKSVHPHQWKPWCFAEVVNKVRAGAMATNF